MKKENEIKNTLKQVEERIKELILKGELTSKNKIQIKIMLESIVRKTLDLQCKKVSESLLRGSDIL